jgi:DNA processing protein
MDDRYASLALGYLRGIDHQFVTRRLRKGVRPAEIVKSLLNSDSECQKSANPIKGDLQSLAPRIKKGLNTIDRLGLQIIALGDEGYLFLLAETMDPPLFLYFLGSFETTSLPQIAIVGSRAPSRAGQRQTYDIAGELVRGGFTVTSGLALGIDAAAHRGALDKGGATIAVMGTGLNQVYPPSNKKLADEIVESGGALITEFPPGTPPRRENFPRRNRIVSGLTSAVVVVEAKARSGSLITARLAAEQGRTVCAIPGGINDPLKAGCHHLIREGAVLVRDAADIAEAAASLIELQRSNVNPIPALQENHANPLVRIMGADPHSFEKLLYLSGLSAAELARTLGELEISGEIYRSAEGYRRAY